jgi:hypothetical protein
MATFVPTAVIIKLSKSALIIDAATKLSLKEFTKVFLKKFIHYIPFFIQWVTTTIQLYEIIKLIYDKINNIINNIFRNNNNNKKSD